MAHALSRHVFALVCVHTVISPHPAQSRNCIVSRVCPHANRRYQALAGDVFQSSSQTVGGEEADEAELGS